MGENRAEALDDAGDLEPKTLYFKLTHFPSDRPVTYVR
jgi:hypothetical protein